MGTIASQITRLMIVYSTVYSGGDRRKYQSSASLAFVRGIHRWPVNSPHKWPVMRKMFPFDDVIMYYRSILKCQIFFLMYRPLNMMILLHFSLSPGSEWQEAHSMEITALSDWIGYISLTQCIMEIEHVTLVATAGIAILLVFYFSVKLQQFIWISGICMCSISKWGRNLNERQALLSEWNPRYNGWRAIVKCK